MAVPMYVLYELGILFAQHTRKQRREAPTQEQEDAAPPGE
jgi:Sec-independent protein secretion pathway component TatC